MAWLNDNLLNDCSIGFVYKIEHSETGEFYIGKKALKCYRTIKGKKVIKESNWKNYWGSNKLFLEFIKKEGEEKFERTILKACKSQYELTYYEIEYIIKGNWIDNKLNYNDNILGKFFKKKLNS